MKRFVYLLIIGLLFILLYNLLPSKEAYTSYDPSNPSCTATQELTTVGINARNDGYQGLNGINPGIWCGNNCLGQYTTSALTDYLAAAGLPLGACNMCNCTDSPPSGAEQAAATKASGAAQAAAIKAGAEAQARAITAAAANEASAEQSMANAEQGIANDTLQNRGNYTHPLVVDIFAGPMACPGPVTCGGVTCGIPNCQCAGKPPNETCGPGGYDGCPPCCPPCQANAPCPEPVLCGGIYCSQPNCICSGDPPTCKPGGCPGCGPGIAPSPASQYIGGLVNKQKGYEAECLSNRAQIAANAATLTSFPAKLKSAYAKLKPMELQINTSTQYIQDSKGILEKFIRNQMAEAAAAAAKADGINIDGVAFGMIPQGAIPKLLWLVDKGIPESEVLLKKLAAQAKTAAAKAK